MKNASAKKVLAVILSLVMVFGLLVSTASAAVTFTDVKPGDWFYKSVMSAVDMGLVKGKTETTYAPNDNLTYAEAVKLAACMHQRYTTGSVTLTKSSSGPWYDTFVAYAKANHIISVDYSWNAKATRAGYMGIFAHALPDSGLQAINSVPDNTIPDVKISDYNGAEIYKLYRAGVVCGVDTKYNCSPGTNIKRSEVAAIVNRMMDTSARISFTTAPGAALAVTSQPASATAAEGGSATFKVAVSGGTTPYTYQWYRVRKGSGNVELVDPNNSYYTDYYTGITTASLTANTLSESVDSGDQYYCVITDKNGNKVTSNRATLTVTAAASLTVTTQPKSLTVDYRGDANFSVAVSGGTPPYSYHWYKITPSGVTMTPSDSTYYSGYNSATLKTVKNFPSTDNGAQYYCVITDANGNSVTSNKATLTVKNSALTVTTQPKSIAITSNATATFSVAVSGGKAPYSYQWHRINKDGTDEPVPNVWYYSGQNTATLTATNNLVEYDNGRKYYCIITDANGNKVTSNTATLTVQ